MIALSDEKRIPIELLGVLAQLGEHLPYKQRVIGSSPIGPTHLDNFILFRSWADSRVAKGDRL